MRGGAQAGFMMVEALAALGLGALVLVALVAFTGLMRRSADRAAARVEVMEVGGRTVATIAGEIRQASRFRWAPEPPAAGAAPTRAPSRTPRAADQRSNAGSQQQDQDDEQPARRPGGPQGEGGSGQENEGRSEQQDSRPFVFTGAPDRVIFVLTPELANGLRAPVVVAYQIDAAGAVLRAEGALPQKATGIGGVRLGPVSRIEPGPERLRFAFVDRMPDGSETIIDAWTEPKRMPAAVRIDRADPRTGIVFASLRVPLLLTAEPGCADPQKGFCSRVDRSQGQGEGQRPPDPNARPAAEGEPG